MISRKFEGNGIVSDMKNQTKAWLYQREQYFIQIYAV